MSIQDIQDYINHQVTMNSHTLELYSEDEIVHEVIEVPTPTVMFISDIMAKKFVLPDTLSVFDLDTVEQNLPIDFNIPQSLEAIILHEKNIQNKNIMELFNFKYRYVNCTLNGVSLNELISRLYEKYFNKDPKYVTNRLANQNLRNTNTMYSKIHSHLTNEILEYEQRLKQAKAFSRTIKEELIAAAFHPDRIGPLIMKYGIHIIEDL